MFHYVADKHLGMLTKAMSAVDSFEAATSWSVKREYKQSQHFRATAGLACVRHPLKAMRAYLLYHLFPADESVWKKMGEPLWMVLLASRTRALALP